MSLKIHESYSTQYPQSNSGADNSFSAEVAGWASTIDEGATKATLSELLDKIDEALADPQKRAELEAQGITSEYVAQLRNGLENLKDYDQHEWSAFFFALENIGGQGSFGLLSYARLMLLEFSLGVVALRLDAHQRNNANQEKIEIAVTAIQTLAENSDGEVALSPEILTYLKASGLTAEDVSDPKLKRILNGEDPATILFSSEELTSLADQLLDAGIRKAESSELMLLNELKEAINRRDEGYRFISNSEANLHATKMNMADKIGNS